MESFEQVAWDDFNEIVINKYFVHEAGFGSRAIPTYVREWIISHYLDDMTELSDGARDKIAKFVQKYAPAKSQKEAIKNDLFEQLEVKLLDNLSVYVNLAKGDRYLNIPYLDEDGAFTTPQIVQENEMLLSSGLWGVGTFYYVPKSDANPQGQIWMREFQPFQLANLDLGYLQECRADFSTQEWIDFLVSSMGFNCNLYSERQKILLICRLIPMVEPRYNLVELAPKGTGKSFVFENMSRYVAVRSGAITPAVLFFNDSRKTPGLITRYDCVVIDEAQKVKADSSGELTALLKSYLEAGSFGRGSASSITAEAGLVMLANIELDHRKQPIYEPVGLLRVFPNFLRETAFIDRFSGLLPGWDLPRVTKETPSRAIGLKGDIFGEILHSLRSDISYRDYVKLNMELENCDDMRDSKSIEAGTTGLLKIIFPDMKPSEEDFYKYCVNPALELRQRVRDELCKLDREYDSVSFYSKYPDQFQSTHQPAKYISPEEVQDFETTPKILLPDQEVDQDDVALQAYFGEKDIPNEFEETEETESELKPKTININEGDIGNTYESLFGPYLEGGKSIKVFDPYIRFEYQIQNFLAFVGILDSKIGNEKIHLVTGADDEYKQQAAKYKFDKLADDLKKHKIEFTFEFDPSRHDRKILIDNGWSIYPGRGLDIYQKPESNYELGGIDQAKRSCKRTEIVYVKSEG